jgi:hypothetical protein
MTLAKAIADPRIDEAAQNSFQLLPVRVFLLLGGLPFALGALGATVALGVSGTILAAEAWTYVVTRGFRDQRNVTVGMRLRFLLSAFTTTCAWLSLSGACWLSGNPVLYVAAVAMWAGQLLFIVSFMQSSRATLIVTGAPTNLTAMALPWIVKSGTTPADVYAAVVLVLVFGFSIIGARISYKRAHELRRVTASLDEQ